MIRVDAAPGDPSRAAATPRSHRAWWRRRLDAHLRAHPICERCGERPSEQLDHVVPLHRGGAEEDIRNIQALCTPCHRRKTRLDLGIVAPTFDLDGNPSENLDHQIAPTA